jgi:hypothetical protein
VNRQEKPVKPLEIPPEFFKSAGWDEWHLQNLSNRAARRGHGRRSTHMAITKQMRMMFYALAILEMLLLSAFYAWGRVAH